MLGAKWLRLRGKLSSSDLDIRQIATPVLGAVENAPEHRSKLALVPNSQPTDAFLLDQTTADSAYPSSAETTEIATRSVTTGDPLRYGLRLAKTAIDSTDDFYAAKFLGCLNERFGISTQLYSTVAVVKVSDSSKEAALLLSATATENIVIEVVRLVQSYGWSIAKQGYQAWICNSSIVMSASQGHLDEKTFNTSRLGTQDKSALWQSFIDIAQAGFNLGANDIDYILDMSNPVSQVAFKVEGRYLKLDKWKLPTDTVFQMLGAAWQKGLGGAEATFQPKIEQQAQISLQLANHEKVRLRWSGMSVDKGCVVTLRIQRLSTTSSIQTLEGCGYSPWHLDAFMRTIQTKGGLTTLAGTVGSGKTVTLAILMAMLPADIKKISIEDPVEIDQPETHQKTIIRDLVQTSENGDAALASAVRALFRSALDALLLGEIRDVETGRVMRAIIDSGHTTLTTTHASSAIGVFNKYMSPQVGIPVDFLGTPGNIRLNTFQTLVSRLCPHCSRPPSDFAVEQLLRGKELTDHHAYVGQIESLYRFSGAQLRFKNPHGCPKCRKPDLPQLYGLMGRTVAPEMVEPDDAMLEMILRGEKVEILKYWRSLSDGSVESDDFSGKTAMEAAMHKASKGIIDPREVEHQFESFAGLAHKRAASLRSETHK